MRRYFRIALATLLLVASPSLAQQVGSIRGSVYDNDFDEPLAGAEVRINETGQQAITDEAGRYVINEVEPGTYSVTVTRSGFTRETRSVAVGAGQLTDHDVRLEAEFTDMDEFIVQDVQIESATEAGQIDIRLESPAFESGVSKELIDQAGASDAAQAVTLVSGVTVQDGKFATVRGLPDRFVSSQMNGVRLPTADAERRAVELDQFPASVIERIAVLKTFTPDQQGDASGGAVNVILRGVPDQSFISASLQTKYKTNTPMNGGFLTYKGGGIDFWGNDTGSRDIQPAFSDPSPAVGTYKGAVGKSFGNAPTMYKFGVSAGIRQELTEEITVGAMASFSYEQDASAINDGKLDDLAVQNYGVGAIVPATTGILGEIDYNSNLWDYKQHEQEVKWSGLGTLGIEGYGQELKLVYLTTRVTTDTVTVEEETRGKALFWPGYDPADPDSPGYRLGPEWRRNETLAYVERTTQTLQISGKHTIPMWDLKLDGFFELLDPEVDWTVAFSEATKNEPDKRQFGTAWIPAFAFAGMKFGDDAHYPRTPGTSAGLGNLQRIWRDLTETSDQYFVNLKIPFRQWTESEGYVKFGLFNDEVERHYSQQTFSNPADGGPGSYPAPWPDFWSTVFPYEYHKIRPTNVDVNYVGNQTIEALYWMVDLPLTAELKLIGGFRYESTDLSTKIDPDPGVLWIPPGATTAVVLNPGDADVNFQQRDVLPSISLIYTPIDQLTIRAAYAETVARQTFREITPVQQQEFLGDDVFVGNPELQMASVKNYDLRIDYTPYEGGLVSVAYFYKDVTDPIEYIQRSLTFLTYTTPVNFPKGHLSGWEVEVRQDLGHFYEPLNGLVLGGNLTLIDSEVKLPQEIQDQLAISGIPASTRQMTFAPEYLYNLFASYELEQTGTTLGVVYQVRGPTLIAGAAAGGANRWIPDVYENTVGTLNLTLAQKIGEHAKLSFKVKNLLDPEIQEIYRSDYASGGPAVKESYKKGIEFSLGISAEFKF